MQQASRDLQARYATAEALQEAIEGYLEKLPKIGPRRVGRMLSEVFEDRRAAVRTEIERRLAGPEPQESAAVPRLRAAAAAQEPTTSSPAERSAAREAETRAEAKVADRTKTPAALSSTPPPRRAGRRSGAILAGLVSVALVAGGALLARALRPGGAGSLPPVTSTRGSVGGARECTGNRECLEAHGGAPFLCRKSDGRCVDSSLHGCQPHASPQDYADDRTLWFGLMVATSGQVWKEFGERDVHVTELAVGHFNKVTGGIPSQTSPESASPLAFIVCDDTADGLEKARYLAEEVRVPAVIGFTDSKSAIDLASREFLPKHVVTIVSSGASPAIRSIPQPEGSPRLLWRTTTPVDAAAPAAAAVVERLFEPQIRREAGMLASSPLRVALLRRGTAAGISFSDALLALLRFNGKTALENGPDFADISYGDPARRAATAPDYAKAVQRVLDLRPHVVVLFGDEEVPGDLLEPIERGWPRDARYRPYYLLETNLIQPEMLAFLGSDRSRLHRTRGMGVPSATAPNARLVAEYNAAFSDWITTASAPADQYDSVYLLAYAMFASGEEVPTGEGIARGILRLLPPGRPIDVGPGPILQAVDVLRRGGNIDLNGGMTPLDFSLATGDSVSSQVVTCARLDEHGRAVDDQDSGLVYDATRKELVGTMKCP